jgi:energy-coupling factor transporter ATP-binding protein EcfA2
MGRILSQTLRAARVSNKDLGRLLGSFSKRPSKSLTKRPKPVNLRHMPVSRRIKSIFRKFKDNPYPDGQLTFKALLYEIYKEPISMTEDERPYSNGLVRFLEREGEILERYDKYERTARDEDDAPFYYGGYTLYLYKDNLIPVKQGDEGVVTVDAYYPTSRKCVLDKFKKYLIPEKGDSKVSILVSRNGGLTAQKVSFPAPCIDDLDLNYGTGFKKTHAKIVEKLEARNGKIFLFSGHMGSGKSTYIKYLTSILGREVLWIPVNMVGNLASPDFISLLMSRKECVLILEDAEQAIQQRGSGSDDSAIATLLNLSDGVLGSLLNISIIITLNADRSTLDKAIFRKGRLAYDFDFKPLSVQDSNRLLKHLGKTQTTETPLTLAEIYGVDDENGHQATITPSRQVGFHTLMNGLTPNPAPVKEKAEDVKKS